MYHPVILPTTADLRTRPRRATRSTSPHRRRPLAAAVAALTGLAGLMLGGLETTAWAATTAISIQASSSGGPVGSQIYGSATLGYGSNPTGTITFRMYPPTDPTCAAPPAFTADTVVTGNGYHESTRYVTTMAGEHRWTATYNGDAANTPSATLCTAPSAVVSVAKRQPTLTGSATSAVLKLVTSASGTLNGASPTGTMLFRLWGPNNMTCAGSPIQTYTEPVSGNGTYTSPRFLAVLPGRYNWKVNYNGDANNGYAGTICSDPATTVNLVAPVNTVTLDATPTAAAPGVVLTVTWAGIASPTTTDWIALYSIGADHSAIRKWRYTSGTPSGSVTLRIPWGTPDGSYELRLFAKNSYKLLATSGVVTVTRPIT